MTNEVSFYENSESIIAQERAVIDSQIATARAYPRNLAKVKDNCIAIVSMDKETAASCRYVKPQGGKQITGESVHLARIIAQQYGNLRVQQRIREIGAKEVVAEAVAHDLENNVAVSVEARRLIIDRDGRRFPEHMINTTAMAALAIAERNAILKVIPIGITKAVYNAAFKTSIGDLSDEQKVLAAKKKAFDFFEKKYGAKPEDILRALGLRSETQIDAEEIANLRGFLQALEDKEITPEELFGWGKKKEDAPNPLAEQSRSSSEKPNSSEKNDAKQETKKPEKSEPQQKIENPEKPEPKLEI